MKPEDIKSSAKDLGGSVGKSAEEAKQTLKDSASWTNDQVQSFASQASDTASDLYGRAKDKLRDATDGLPNSASDAVAAGQKAYDKGTEQLARHVAKQPLEALILAGAIGYLVGWATTRG